MNKFAITIQSYKSVYQTETLISYVDSYKQELKHFLQLVEPESYYFRLAYHDNFPDKISPHFHGVISTELDLDEVRHIATNYKLYNNLSYHIVVVHNLEGWISYTNNQATPETYKFNYNFKKAVIFKSRNILI